MKLSIALREVMSKSGLTQYRLSKLSGLDAANVSRIVKGESESPGWLNVERLIDGVAKYGIGWKGYLLAILPEPDEVADMSEIALTDAEDLAEALFSEARDQANALTPQEALFFEGVVAITLYRVGKRAKVEELVSILEDILNQGVNKRKAQRFRELITSTMERINSNE